MIILQTLIMISIITLIPSVSLILTVRNQEKILVKNAEEAFQKQAELTATKVNNWIDKTLLSLNQNAITGSIISMDPKIQVPVLEASAKLAEPSSYRFFTIDLQGNVIARSDGNKLKNYSDRAYFRSILEGEEFGQQIVLGRISGRPALCLSVPIRSVPLKQLVGVLAGCADLIDISNSVSEIRIGETGFAFLVDSNKNVIIHGKPLGIFSEKSPDFSHHPIFQGSRDGEQTFSTYQDQGREVIGFKQPIKLGWTLVIQQDTLEAFSLINETKKSTNILITITFFLTTLIIYFFIRVSLELNHKLAELSLMDELTKIPNRRFFELESSNYWKKAYLEQRSFAIAMLDLDYFKQYNDRYGHQKGDFCLKQVAQVIYKSVGQHQDFVARYGGEEFILLLRNINVTSAEERIKKVLDEIRSLGIPHEGSQISPIVTASSGVCVAIPSEIKVLDHIIAQADQNLYHAKAAGRNCVIVSHWDEKQG